MFLQEFIHEVIDFYQLVIYALFHRQSPFGGRSCVASTFYLP
jgi:hypothetical protein